MPFLSEKLSKTNALYVALIQPLRSISLYPNLIYHNLELGILLDDSIITFRTNIKFKVLEDDYITLNYHDVSKADIYGGRALP